jgi:hypothetical protein
MQTGYDPAGSETASVASSTYSRRRVSITVDRLLKTGSASRPDRISDPLDMAFKVLSENTSRLKMRTLRAAREMTPDERAVDAETKDLLQRRAMWTVETRLKLAKMHKEQTSQAVNSPSDVS